MQAVGEIRESINNVLTDQDDLHVFTDIEGNIVARITFTW